MLNNPLTRLWSGGYSKSTIAERSLSNTFMIEWKFKMGSNPVIMLDGYDVKAMPGLG